MVNIIHPKAQNYFLDTEFFDPETEGFSIDFFSIGLVSESGKKFYGVSDDFNDEAYRGAWVYENVIQKLPPKAQRQDLKTIKAGLLSVFEAGAARVDIWAKNGAYDFYVLSRMFPRQLDLKAALKEKFGITRVRFRDTNELLDLAPDDLVLSDQDPATHHISIDDACHEREVFLTIKNAMD
jgi:hypothetical protein